MRTMLVLVALLGLAAYPAMAAASGEKGPQESPSMALVPAGGVHDGECDGRFRRTT